MKDTTANYEDQTTDIEMYWNEKLPKVHFTTIGVKLFDSQMNPTKAAELLVCRLVEPTSLFFKDDSGEGAEIEAKAGDLFGIWVKPGMKGIQNVQGRKTTLVREPERDKLLRKGQNPMKGFIVASEKGQKHPVPILQDSRDRSKSADTIFDQWSKESGESAPF